MLFFCLRKIFKVFPKSHLEARSQISTHLFSTMLLPCLQQISLFDLPYFYFFKIVLQLYLFSYLSLHLLCGDEAENCTTLEFSSRADRDAKAAVFSRLCHNFTTCICILIRNCICICICLSICICICICNVFLNIFQYSTFLK